MDFVLTILRRARPRTPPQGFSENQTLSQRIIIPWGRGPRRGWAATKFAPRSGRRDHPLPGPAPPPPAAGSPAPLASRALLSKEPQAARRAHSRLRASPARPSSARRKARGGGRSRLPPGRVAPAAPKGVRGRGATAVAAGAAAALGEGGRALPAWSRSRHRACPEAAGRGAVRSPGFLGSRLGWEAGRGSRWRGREKARGKGTRGFRGADRTT